jgi:tRNA(Ile)-lysidine synthase
MPASAIQEKARAARYLAIAGWLLERGLGTVCTGHHRDDQAETFLMRLARGSGVRGLAAMRPSAPLPGAADLQLLRPLLGWSRTELVAICAAADLAPVSDPSNADGQFERVRVRQLLAGEQWLAGDALARSADALRSADEAIEWAVDCEWAEAVEEIGSALVYRPGSAPAEIRRRILVRIVASLATEGVDVIRGREVTQILEKLESGGTATLRGVVARGGSTWRFEAAPPRSSTCG